MSQCLINETIMAKLRCMHKQITLKFANLVSAEVSVSILAFGSSQV